MLDNEEEGSNIKSNNTNSNKRIKNIVTSHVQYSTGNNNNSPYGFVFGIGTTVLTRAIHS